MEERSSHLTVVIGASRVAEQLRRSLLRRQLSHSGISTHLRGLRRSLVLGENPLVVLCIALDEATLGRHGAVLKGLLADRRSFSCHFRSVGLLDGRGLTSAAAELGCDVYVNDLRQAGRAMQLLSRSGRDDWSHRLARSCGHPVRDDRSEQWNANGAFPCEQVAITLAGHLGGGIVRRPVRVSGSDGSCIRRHAGAGPIAGGLPTSAD
jgi:hypothetical protein